MLVYLVRHGEALSELEDPLRPLSEVGKYNIRRMAKLIDSRISVHPGYVFHSPKARAHQTASILCDVLSESLLPIERDGLLPLDDPSIWGDRLVDMDKDTLIVGHLPHLSKLASFLLLWEPGKDIINFLPGTVLCLEKTESWKVNWMLSPRVLKAES